MPLARIAERSVGIGDRLVEKIAAGLKVGELGDKVGFARDQTIAIGCRGLMIAA